MSWIPVFSAQQLRQNAWESGFSVYQGVLVEWDEDFDQRVLVWIDSLKPQVRNRLYSAAERKGGLCLKWRSGPIPKALSENGRGVTVEGDCWDIYESAVLTPKDIPSCALVKLPVCDMVTRDKWIS